MSRTTIHCPHCGQNTRVDLSMQLSTQKCDRCGVRFSAVDTGHTSSKELQPTEAPDWRRAKIGDWDEARDMAAGRAGLPRGVWAVAVGGFLLVVGAVIGLALRRGDTTLPAPMAAPADSGIAGVAASTGGTEASGYDRLRIRLDQAIKAAERYLTVADVDALLPLVQHRDRLERRIRNYYSTGEGVGTLPLPPASIAPLDRQLYVEHLQSVIVSYQIPGQIPRAVAVREDPPDTWLVDWPSAVALNEMPIEEFVAQRESKPRLCRMLAAFDDYYNRSFADDGKWLCLKLSHPELKTSLFGYVERQSPAGTALAAVRLPRKGPGTPVLVRLQFPAEAPVDNQVEITEFVGIGWLLASIDQEPGVTGPPPADTPSPLQPEKSSRSPVDGKK